MRASVVVCALMAAVLSVVPAADPDVVAAVPSITIDPADDLFDGYFVSVAGSGFSANTQLYLVECRTTATSPAGCDTGNARTAITGQDGTFTATWDIARIIYTEEDPLGVDCAQASGVCSLAAADYPVLSQVALTPLDVLPDPTMSLEPSVDLLDGQEMTASGNNVRAGGEYDFYHCKGDAFGCEFVTTAIGSADNTLTASVPATQRIGATTYCRADCVVRMAGPGTAWTPAGFAMASGVIEVEPSTDLNAGSPVDVSGSLLMPTYDGRLIGPFETGRWAIAQCDGNLGSAPSLYDLFVNCAFNSALKIVTVESSVLPPTSVTPEATITRILGGTTDCAAASGACVLGLYRFEQDGSVSSYSTPISFQSG